MPSDRVERAITVLCQQAEMWGCYTRKVRAARAALVAAIDAEVEAARIEGSNGIGLTKPPDSRDPDPTRTGFWALHNCAGCENGKWQCITDGGRNYCDGPRAEGRLVEKERSDHG